MGDGVWEMDRLLWHCHSDPVQTESFKSMEGVRVEVQTRDLLARSTQDKVPGLHLMKWRFRFAVLTKQPRTEFLLSDKMG